VLHLIVTVHVLAVRTGTRLTGGRCTGQRGQSTAEYALVLLGAAAVAALLMGWATSTDRIGRLLNTVLDRVLGQVRG
jgi:hypothetical protein